MKVAVVLVALLVPLGLYAQEGSIDIKDMGATPAGNTAGTVAPAPDNTGSTDVTPPASGETQVLPEKGDKGDQGDKGDKGDPGSAGTPGTPGQPGTPGAPGKNGRNGRNGRDAQLPPDWKREEAQGWSGDATESCLAGRKDASGKVHTAAGAPMPRDEAAAMEQCGQAKVEKAAAKHTDKVIRDEAVARKAGDNGTIILFLTLVGVLGACAVAYFLTEE